MSDAHAQITQLLARVGAGDRGAREQLADAVYAQLVQLAHGQRLRWGPRAPAGTRTLAHEVFMRLSAAADAPNGEGSAPPGIDFESRRHYFAAASKAMRNLLIDRARKNLAAKRGPLEVEHAKVEDAEQMLMLDESLTRLFEVDGRLAQVVELRVFGGLEHGELAEQLGVSERSARRHWARARAWLEREFAFAKQPNTGSTVERAQAGHGVSRTSRGGEGGGPS